MPSIALSSSHLLNISFYLARRFKYLFWGILNRYIPGRFRSIGRGVRFNGLVRFEKSGKDIRVGSQTMIGVGCYFCADQGGTILIGNNVGINDFCYITSVCSITIEDNVRIAEFVSIRDFDHEFSKYDIPIHLQGLRSAPIRIGQGSWIGRGVMITSGVTVGQGCVIGANAVVTRDLPAWSIAVGVPARVIKYRLPSA